MKKNSLKTACVIMFCAVVWTMFGVRTNGQSEQQGKTQLEPRDSTIEFAYQRVAWTDNVISLNWMFDTKIFIDWPTAGEEPLLTSVRKWINDLVGRCVTYNEWGSKYAGSMDDGQEVLNYYGKIFHEKYRYAEDSVTAEEREKMKKEAEGRTEEEWKRCMYCIHWIIMPVCWCTKFVTYGEYYNEYEGGSHGLLVNDYKSFYRDSGKAATWDIIRADKLDELGKVIGTHLYNEFFPGEYDYEKNNDWYKAFATEGISYITDDDKHTLPKNSQPYFTETGVGFQYDYYELGPFYIGAPYCVIPYKELIPYMTEKGKAFAREVISEENKFYPKRSLDTEWDTVMDGDWL